MTHVADDHFLRQFDRYQRGPDREAAMARHAALLYNHAMDEKAQYDAMLAEVLELLRLNMFVAAALAITTFQQEQG